MEKQELIDKLAGAGYSAAMLARMSKVELARLEEIAPEPGVKAPEPPTLEARIIRGCGLTQEQYDRGKR